ncbi:MAG: fumarylacetoacetate hydrolase family protein [Halanaerobiales bacterium]
MRIIRYSYRGEKSFGLLEGSKVKKVKGSPFLNLNYGRVVAEFEEVELLPPVSPPNIIAIGLNYRKHAEESGSDIPKKPVVFLKATTSLTGPESKIKLPEIAPDEVDYEAELAVVIGKKAKNVSKKEALDYVFGYTCGNDVSARDCQKKLDKQWARAKSFDTFCPLGPWIETDLEPDNCQISSVLNGVVMQESNTADMIFNVREVVSYLSKNMTLLPGTVIMTGTPEGVGFARKNPVFLRTGDKVEIKIEGIGTLSNCVV